MSAIRTFKPEASRRYKYLTSACENLENSADRVNHMLAANAQELIDWAMSLLETCEKLEEENCLLRGQVEDLSKTE
jgi:hypothetical protein